MMAVRTAPASEAALQALKLLTDETRWRLLSALRRSDYQVGELVELLGLSQNLVSYHLGLLRQAGFVRAQRNSADARSQYYSADVAALEASLRQIGAGLHLPLSSGEDIPARTVVFLCTGNSARSQMAEGWLRALSNGRVAARSAGTHPRSLHPLATLAMAEAGVDIAYQQAKDLPALDAIAADVVVTVCDLAREECPSWQLSAAHLHWSIPDPARAQGSEAEQLAVFRSVRETLRERVVTLLALLPTLTSVPVSESKEPMKKQQRRA
jgi:ArsR family transcriptional regulator, arsenate/arsenite/antimonite-responsive transcriptional repressor / arsenate reductase (thioredoxin)